MDLTLITPQIKELIEKSNDILIISHEHPTADSIGSSLALYLGLTGMGKRVSIACPDAMTVALSNFIGVNKITTDLGRKNFVISLDYVDGSIEKVSYNIEGDKFHLVIEPRPAHEFDEHKVHYSHEGATADLIIVVDTIHLGGLKNLYEGQKDLFATKPIINIDRHPNNSNFGQVNVVDPKASSTSELVAQCMSGIGVTLTMDIANNLLNALYITTNNFTSIGIGAAAFEVAAVCAKAGATKFTPAIVSDGISADQPVDNTPTISVPQIPKVPTSIPEQVKLAPKPTSTASASAPEDWLKPKIFKSTSIS